MRRYLRLALVVIALAALLVPLLSELAREVLLVELLRFAWRVDRLVDSLPQEPFWLAFLFIAVLVAAVSLLPRLQASDRPSNAARRPPGQVADLALLIRRAGRRAYFRRRLVRRLSQLGREVFAQRHGVDAHDLDNGSGPAGRGRLLTAGHAQPAGKQTQAGAAGDASHPGMSLQQALAHLRVEPPAAQGVDDPAIEAFVQFLEDQMEVEDGRFNRSRR